MNNYTPLDAARNLLTLAAAVVLTVFHKDVTAYVSAAAVLVAGGDAVFTTVVKGKGGILHRIEVGVYDLAQAVEGSAQALPASSPKTVEHVAAAANAVAQAAQTVVAATQATPPAAAAPAPPVAPAPATVAAGPVASQPASS